MIINRGGHASLSGHNNRNEYRCRRSRWHHHSIAFHHIHSTRLDGFVHSLRRRRVETAQASRFVERLFGLELTQDKIDQGSAFIDGVFARAGAPALAALWSDVEHLPTPNELQAPGLWLARVGLESDQPLPELDDDPGIPDFPDLDG